LRRRPRHWITTVEALPEAVALSPNGSHIYLDLSRHFLDTDVSVLGVDGATVTDTGQRLKMPGPPRSMRAGPQ
jgi:hypothetical protein